MSILCILALEMMFAKEYVQNLSPVAASMLVAGISRSLSDFFASQIKMRFKSRSAIVTYGKIITGALILKNSGTIWPPTLDIQVKLIGDKGESNKILGTVYLAVDLKSVDSKFVIEYKKRAYPAETVDACAAFICGFVEDELREKRLMV